MKAKKQVFVTMLVVVLLAASAIGGTLAYLTDSDSETNVFTIGNVEIDLIEEYEQGSKLVPGVDIKKEAKIENTGSNDAYVWMTIAVPSELDTIAPPMLQLYSPAINNGDVELQLPTSTTEIDGIEYNVYTLLYKNALKSGESTSLGLSSVCLDTQIDYADGQYYWINGGSATPINFDITNTKVHVSAYAIQKEGFDSVTAAYDAFQEQWKDTN